MPDPGDRPGTANRPETQAIGVRETRIRARQGTGARGAGLPEGQHAVSNFHGKLAAYKLILDPSLKSPHTATDARPGGCAWLLQFVLRIMAFWWWLPHSGHAQRKKNRPQARQSGAIFRDGRAGPVLSPVPLSGRIRVPGGQQQSQNIKTRQAVTGRHGLPMRARPGIGQKVFLWGTSPVAGMPTGKSPVRYASMQMLAARWNATRRSPLKAGIGEIDAQSFACVHSALAALTG